MEIRELWDTGVPGRLLAATQTSADGAFQASVGSYRGWVLVIASGGIYTDEATGQTATIAPETPLAGFAFAGEGGSPSILTPISTIAWRLLQAISHHPSAECNDTVPNALAMAGRFFGLADAGSVVPANLAAGPVAPGPAADHGAAIAAIAQRASQAGIDAMTMTWRIAEDLLDLKGDGAVSGVPLPAGPAALAPELAAALEAFLTTGAGSASGLQTAQTPVHAALQGNANSIIAAPPQILAIDNAYGDARGPVPAIIHLAAPPAFDPSTDAPSVSARIGDVPVSVSAITGNQIAATVSETLPPGVFDLLVTDNVTGLSVRERGAIRIGNGGAAPSLSSIRPATGPPSGGTLLRIRGKNLYPDTQILIDGVPAQVTAHISPEEIEAVTVIRAPGSVDIGASNGGLVSVVPSGFEYRDRKTVGDGPSIPVLAPLRHLSSKLQINSSNRLEFTLTDALITPSNSDSGTFLATDVFLATDGGAPQFRTRSGTSFAGNAVLERQILLFDPATGISDFSKLTINPANPVMAGPTGRGASMAWPVPSGMEAADLKGRWYFNGILVDSISEQTGSLAGWIQFREDGEGSFRMEQYLRDDRGGNQKFGVTGAAFQYDLLSDGRFLGTTIGGGPSDSFEGYFDQTGTLGHLRSSNSAGRLSSFTLSRVPFGTGYSARGPWKGGAGRAGLDSSSQIQLDSIIHQHIYTLDAHPSLPLFGLELDAGTEFTPADPGGTFRTRTSFFEGFVSPSGVVRDSQGNRLGFLNPETGAGLCTGGLPAEIPETLPGDFPVTTGICLAIDSYVSPYTLDGAFSFVGTSETFTGQSGSAAPPSQGLEMRSRFERIVLDPALPGSWQGRPFKLSGSIPAWTGPNMEGIEKIVHRDPVTGAPGATIGPPQPFGGDMLYTGFGSEIHLLATASNHPAGLLAGLDFPSPFAAFRPSSDGEYASAVASISSPASGHFSLFKSGAAAPQIQGAFEGTVFNKELFGGLPAASGVRMSQFSAQAGGPFQPFNVVHDWRFQFNGTTTPGTNTGSGDYAPGPFGSIQWTLPPFIAGGLPRNYVGAATPSGDFAEAIDLTSLPVLGRLTAIKPASAGTPAPCATHLSGLSLNVLPAAAPPHEERSETYTIRFGPEGGTTNWLGEAIIRTNTNPQAGGQTLFQATNPSILGPGRGQIPFLGQLPVLGYLFSNHGRTHARTDLQVFITPRVLSGIEE